MDTHLSSQPLPLVRLQRAINRLCYVATHESHAYEDDPVIIRTEALSALFALESENSVLRLELINMKKRSSETKSSSGLTTTADQAKRR